jgi:hypothetical protein
MSEMNVIHGPARVILRLPTKPGASDADIDKAIEIVPSLQPGLSLYGHNPQTDQWSVVGKITRVWREGKQICQEAALNPDVVVDRFAPVYVQITAVA